MVLGIFGKAGCGKSTLANKLEERGAVRISLDEIGHDVLKDSKTQIVAAFDDRILTEDEIDRNKLAEKVFSDSKLLSTLNSIVHPVIKIKALEKLEDRSRLYVIEGALLQEIGLDEYCDKIIWLDCAREEAIERLIARGMSADRADSILKSQQHLEHLRETADAIVSTRGSTEDTFEKVKDILLKWSVVV